MLFLDIDHGSILQGNKLRQQGKTLKSISNFLCDNLILSYLTLYYPQCAYFTYKIQLSEWDQNQLYKQNQH